ncbi:hypothetical protein EV182_005958, partial [Spiromyces aspiralis]
MKYFTIFSAVTLLSALSASAAPAKRALLPDLIGEVSVDAEICAHIQVVIGDGPQSINPYCPNYVPPNNGGNHGGNNGGNHGGNDGGNHGGNDGGNHGGNDGGNHGGNDGGNHGGNDGGNHGGNDGGNHGGNDGGNNGGNDGGNH